MGDGEMRCGTMGREMAAGLWGGRWLPKQVRDTATVVAPPLGTAQSASDQRKGVEEDE